MKTLLRALGVCMTLALFAIPTAASAATSQGAGLWPLGFQQAAPPDCGTWNLDTNNICSLDDGGSVELGVRFTSSRTLDIVGIRAYRTDAGPLTGSLWTAAGTRLAGPVSFAGSSTHEWQDALFAAPVRITAGERYIASYFTPNAEYAFQWDYFAPGEHTVGPVTALRSVVGNPNGVYCYVGEPCAGFPSNSFRDTNYWVTPLWDDSAPALGTAPNVSAEATGANGAAVSYTAPTATDNADPNPAVSCTPASGTTFPLGDTTVTCTAEDASGNQSSTQFTVTVADTTAPALDPHANVSATATSASGATVTYTAPAATDAVDPDPDVACEPASGTTFAPGDTIVICTATDSSGNSSTSTFLVEVRFVSWHFLPPIGTSKVLKPMKGGSTLPVKWRVRDGQGGYIDDLSIVESVEATQVPCSSTARASLRKARKQTKAKRRPQVASRGEGRRDEGDDDDEDENDGHSRSPLRYDEDDEQFVYKWKTPKRQPGCYRLVVTLIDGSSREVTVTLR